MKTATQCYHYSSDDLEAGMSFPFPTQQRLMGNKIPFINDTSLSVIPAAKQREEVCVCVWIWGGFVHAHAHTHRHTHIPPALSALLSRVNLQCLSYLGRWVKAGRASSGTTHTHSSLPPLSLYPPSSSSFITSGKLGRGGDKNEALARDSQTEWIAWHPDQLALIALSPALRWGVGR